MRDSDEIVMSLEHYELMLNQIGRLKREVELLRMELYRDSKDPRNNLGHAVTS